MKDGMQVAGEAFQSGLLETRGKNSFQRFRVSEIRSLVTTSIRRTTTVMECDYAVKETLAYV